MRKELSLITAARIRFAIKLASLNLEVQRPGDWQNLRDELQGFFSGVQKIGDEGTALLPGDGISPRHPGATLSLRDALSLQNAASQLLNAIVDKPATRVPVSVKFKVNVEKSLLIMGKD